MSFREQISHENSAGILVCPGNGLIGIKLANQLVTLRSHLKCKELTFPDSFAGILARLRASTCIGMELVCQAVLIHWKLVTKTDNGSAIIPV